MFVLLPQSQRAGRVHWQDWQSAVGRASAMCGGVRRTLDHGAQINHHMKYDERVFHEKPHIIKWQQEPWDTRSQNKITVIYLDLHVCGFKCVSLR